MNNAITGISVIILAAIVLVFGVILTTLMGGIVGWIVGWFFSETILITLNRFGVNTFDMTMWQLGATIGFIAGFFRTSTKVHKHG